jgi:hypothetical protein
MKLKLTSAWQRLVALVDRHPPECQRFPETVPPNAVLLPLFFVPPNLLYWAP